MGQRGTRRQISGVENASDHIIRWLTFIVLVLAIWLAPMHGNWAQDGQQGVDVNLVDVTAYPLRPPELDSPRATLRSFIRNATEAIQRWRNELPPEAIRRPLRRAMLCLDLSLFPIATREAVGTEKVLLLKEILDRIKIPPFEEIPDAASVTEKELTAWTIPNTQITMAWVEEGPRSGTFLFTTHTVALLRDFYEIAEFLPYKPGASIGAYEDFIYGPGTLLPRAWIEGLPSWSYEVIGDKPCGSGLLWYCS